MFCLGGVVLLIILLRTFIIYMMVLFAIRIMGKAELSKLDPFQMVILFMIAELASISIESTDISLISGVTAISALLFLEVVISFASIKSQRVNDFFKGKPSILIDKGVINQKELKKLRISIDDLTEHLRLKNQPSIADVNYAILESNGDLSVIPKPAKMPLSREDFNLSQDMDILPMVLISDGNLFQKNLQRIKLTEDQLKKKLAKKKITDYSQVFLCFFDETGQIHIHGKQNATQ